MNGEQTGLRAGEAATGGVPVLRLNLRRVFDGVPRQPVRTEFRFDAASPMVVTVTFSPWRSRAVTWRIGRELLHRGLYEESGEGDVQVWPMQHEGNDRAWMLLESRDSSAVFELPAAEVGQWLDVTYESVPAAAEAAVLDWDDFLGELLGG